MDGSRGDDMFANSSTETVVQNTEGANSAEIVDPSYRAECFVSEVCNFALQFHCPFCCKYFAFEYMLKEHIKVGHEKYWDMLRSDDHILLLYSCLFCHAKYYKKCVLLKHMLYSHHQVVVAVCDTDQLCGFCPYATAAPSRSKLLRHIEQNHPKEFETLIDGMYVHNGKLESTMGSSQRTFTSFPSASPAANYSSPVCKAIESAPVLSPIPKSGHTVRKRLRFDQLGEEQSNNIQCKRKSKWKAFFSFIKLRKGTHDAMIPNFTTSTPKPRSDRRSQMDDIYYLDYDKGKKIRETSFNKIQKRGFSLNIFSRKKSKYRSLSKKCPTEKSITPTSIFKSSKWTNNDEYKIKQYKCAVCLQAFGENVGLVCHARRHHNGLLHLLQPSFKCGLCEATFYKNSFLLRHCKFHHTPLCLRS